MKKPYKQLVKESFTKTRDERYQEMSKGEKIGYWLSILFTFIAMLFMWFR